jgi:hypothetical protein
MKRRISVNAHWPKSCVSVWVKTQNFSQSQHKLGYVYLLTPTGIARKSKLTTEFLKPKTVEYEALRAEIERLKAELPKYSGQVR